MWTELFRQWWRMMFWWLPEQSKEPERTAREQHSSSGTDEAATQAPTPAPERPKAEAPQARAEPAAPVSPDDLTVLKGVGEAMQKKLRGQGINTFSDLAGADADELTARLKETQPVLSKTRVQEWIDAARQRSAQ